MIEARKRSILEQVSGSHRLDVQSVSLTGLFILASVWFLHEARSFAVPLTLAVMLHFLLMPLVRWLKRHRIAETVAATLILLAMIGLLTLMTHQLAQPAAHWLEKAPRAVKLIEQKVLPVKDSMTQITERAMRSTVSVKMSPRPATYSHGNC